MSANVFEQKRGKTLTSTVSFFPLDTLDVFDVLLTFSLADNSFRSFSTFT